jgi:protein involved in polysaccharide export with SLBB domain
MKLKLKVCCPCSLRAAIATALKDEEILVDPVVIVTIVECYSRPISVAGAGEARHTQATGNVTLLEAIARAEGLSAEAGPKSWSAGWGRWFAAFPSRP